MHITCIRHVQSQTQTGQRNNIQSDRQTGTAAVYRTRSERGGRLPAAVASVTHTHCHGVVVLTGLTIGIVFYLA